MNRYLMIAAVTGIMGLDPGAGFAAEKVTVDSFVRAETDMTLDRYVRQGALGKLIHIRMPVPIDRQDVIRMNRDTLYSAGVFDLSAPVTIVKPETGGRFQSMLVINQDHSMLPAEHGAGEFTFTQEKMGTRYMIVLFRTFVDSNDPTDIKAANALQDKIVVKQAAPGKFEIPEWDEASLKKVRDAINVLAATRTSAKGMFGDKAKLDPISTCSARPSAGAGIRKKPPFTTTLCLRRTTARRPIRSRSRTCLSMASGPSPFTTKTASWRRTTRTSTRTTT